MTKKDVVYVGTQLALFILYAFCNGSIVVGYELRSVGLGMSTVGLLIILISILQLNKSLRPFPSPKEGGELITTGLYSVVRHPIYLGIIILFSGYSIFSASWIRLVVTVLLALLFDFKSKYEEDLLVQKFSSYKTYQKSTNRIIPFI